MSPNQEKISMKVIKSILLEKLRLSEKFPRTLLRIQKSALGVGLMILSAIAAVLALQPCFEYKRKVDRTAKMIQVAEDNKAM